MKLIEIHSLKYLNLDNVVQVEYDEYDNRTEILLTNNVIIYADREVFDAVQKYYNEMEV